MRNLRSVVAALAIAACGGGNKPAATSPTPAAAATTAPVAGGLELADLKFYAGEELGFQLHANGHLEAHVTKTADGKPVPAIWVAAGDIAADGSVTDDNGQKQGVIQSDGSFKTPDGQTAPFHLEGETLVIADKKLTLDDHGNLMGLDSGATMRIEGATTPGRKRTALILLAIMVSSPSGGGAHE